MDPQNSVVFQRYPTLLKHADRLQFLCNGLKPVIDGKIKPDQLEYLMESEFQAKAEEAEHPSLCSSSTATRSPASGSSRPCSASSTPWRPSPTAPRWSAERVGGGPHLDTLLGIFLAYGFVNPMANRIAR